MSYSDILVIYFNLRGMLFCGLRLDVVAWYLLSFSGLYCFSRPAICGRIEGPCLRSIQYGQLLDKSVKIYQLLLEEEQVRGRYSTQECFAIDNHICLCFAVGPVFCGRDVEKFGENCDSIANDLFCLDLNLCRFRWQRLSLFILGSICPRNASEECRFLESVMSFSK